MDSAIDSITHDIAEVKHTVHKPGVLMEEINSKVNIQGTILLGMQEEFKRL
jgi:hypothetical protein